MTAQHIKPVTQRFWDERFKSYNFLNPYFQHVYGSLRPEIKKKKYEDKIVVFFVTIKMHRAPKFRHMIIQRISLEIPSITF